MESKKHFISLIVPAFKQEKTIRQNLLAIVSSLRKLEYDSEVLVVVDGTVDNTLEKAKEIKSPKIKVFGYKNNRGKGYAIRYGMVRSKGDIICFIDAGIDLNPNGIPILLKHFEWHDADIVIGSKRHPDSKVSYPFLRRLISYLSQIFIRFLFGLDVKDTQVGMKFFRRKVIEDIMPRLLVKKFAFDIEMLVVAHSLGYKKIFEAPVELTYDFHGSLIRKNILVELFRTFWDTLAIFYRLRLLGYYNDKNKRKWMYDPELEFKVNIG